MYRLMDDHNSDSSYEEKLPPKKKLKATLVKTSLELTLTKNKVTELLTEMESQEKKHNDEIDREFRCQ